MKKQYLIATLLLFFGLPVFAAGDGVPLGTVTTQLANLAILVGFIYFSQRKTIAQAIADKKKSFLDSVDAASNSKKEANDVLHEVSTRLEKIKSTFSAQVEKAKADAEESYRTQLANAKNETIRLKSSAQDNLEFEVQRQIEQLRIEAYQMSANNAEKELEKKLTPEQLKSWNSHFVSNAKGAH